jgi:hypothetical protein
VLHLPPVHSPQATVRRDLAVIPGATPVNASERAKASRPVSKPPPIDSLELNDEEKDEQEGRARRHDGPEEERLKISRYCDPTTKDDRRRRGEGAYPKADHGQRGEIREHGQ